MKVLRSRGAKTVRLEIPHMDAVNTYASILSRVEGATIHAQWMRERPEDYSVHLGGRLYAGYAIPAVHYNMWKRYRDAVRSCAHWEVKYSARSTCL
jgi:aspartyl-tRNA(Asn)/glutamyl-tRNA(Gln) amidotransferase subunit A